MKNIRSRTPGPPEHDFDRMIFEKKCPKIARPPGFLSEVILGRVLPLWGWGLLVEGHGLVGVVEHVVDAGDRQNEPGFHRVALTGFSQVLECCIGLVQT